VYDGAENTFNVKGLESYRRYFITIFEYNVDGFGKIKYMADHAPVASQQTRLLPNVYLVKPGNGTVNQYPILTLKANAVTGATHYTFEISTNANFTGSKIISGGISVSLDSLHYNTLYYAHVKTNLRDDFGKVTTFTTCTAESLAYVTSPANNAVNTSTSPAIASNKIPYASVYTIQLSETNDFAVVAFEVTGPTRISHFTGLKANTTYYSRVRVDLSSAFGAVKSFTTAPSLARMSGNSTETELREFAVTVYPNPFREKFTLSIESANDDQAQITLIDLNSKPVYQSSIKTNSVVEISKPFANGVYVLKVDVGGSTKLIRVVRIE
jgi:hypothetical protein